MNMALRDDTRKAAVAAIEYFAARYVHTNRHDLFLTVSGIVPDG
jgi:hypothetical protein